MRARRAAALATAPSEAPVAAVTGVASLVGRTMDEVERELILHTLTHTLGNRTHAAMILGISIRALRNKLRDYTQAGVAVPPSGSTRRGRRRGAAGRWRTRAWWRGCGRCRRRSGG